MLTYQLRLSMKFGSKLSYHFSILYGLRFTEGEPLYCNIWMLSREILRIKIRQPGIWLTRIGILCSTQRQVMHQLIHHQDFCARCVDIDDTCPLFCYSRSASRSCSYLLIWSSKLMHANIPFCIVILHVHKELRVL